MQMPRAPDANSARPADPANLYFSMPLAYIALGANLPSPAGPPDATLAAASRSSLLGQITARSSLYSTAPVGSRRSAPLPQRRHRTLNRSPPTHLLDPFSPSSATSAATAQPLPNGPRTLDLDLLLYGDLVLSEFDLEIPHPRLAQRAFVLVPLDEISPHAVDPRSGLTAAQLLANLPPAADPGAVVRIASPLWPTD